KTKYLLRKVSEQYLPKNITDRPKASFGAPIRSWIMNDLDEMVMDLLSPDTLKKRGMFDPARVEKLIDDNKKGKADNAYQLYHLLTLELWMREFLD
ncbi:MAG: asparagine synthase C-terminal domain-containing protein, partial [Cyclobacteriaceae bacterium]|nr:asparagine synthase C-terminal domain-containing protein [Cyclobacteriaceae bacterium]